VRKRRGGGGNALAMYVRLKAGILPEEGNGPAEQPRKEEGKIILNLNKGAIEKKSSRFKKVQREVCRIK